VDIILDRLGGEAGDDSQFEALKHQVALADGHLCAVQGAQIIADLAWRVGCPVYPGAFDGMAEGLRRAAHPGVYRYEGEISPCLQGVGADAGALIAKAARLPRIKSDYERPPAIDAFTGGLDAYTDALAGVVEVDAKEVVCWLVWGWACFME